MINIRIYKDYVFGFGLLSGLLYPNLLCSGNGPSVLPTISKSGLVILRR